MVTIEALQLRVSQLAYAIEMKNVDALSEQIVARRVADTNGKVTQHA